MSDRPRYEVIAMNPNLPMIALPLEEAAAAVGMSLKSFNRWVRPDIKLVRRGSMVLAPVRELERWTEQNAESVFGHNGGYGRAA